MAKVAVTKDKLDNLALSVSAKSGEPMPLTIDEMVAAVDGIETGGPEMPTFTLGEDELTGDIVVTCDKTYSQCLDIQATTFAAVLVVPDYVDMYIGLNCVVLFDQSDNPFLSYRSYDSGMPAFQIDYMPNGDIVFSEVPQDLYSTLSVTSNGTYQADWGTLWSEVEVNVSAPSPILQSKTATPTESAQTITPDSGYDGLSSVSVGAISSSYVGSGITQRSSSDLTASGATVTAPAGYYASSASKSVASGSVTGATTEYTSSTAVFGYRTVNGAKKLNVYIDDVPTTPAVSAGYVSAVASSTRDVVANTSYDYDPEITVSGATVTVPEGYYSSAASKSVASGTEGTPTATKGTVSNHAVSVTPSVTNSAGYISGGTKTGTAVSVSASELVSGTYSVTSSGTKDVANYASASVPSGSVSASAAKGTVSNHSVSVTPTATVGTAGFVAAGSTNGTAVSVSASELVSGTYSVTSSGTKDVTNYASASIAAGSATASATKGSVSNHAISVTPSVTRTAGYVTAGSANGTAVTVSASELVSGNLAIIENGTDIDVTNYATVSVDVAGGGGGGGGGIATDLNDSHTDTMAIFSMQSEPSSFAMFCLDSSISPSATARVASIVYDGTTKHEQVITNVTNSQVDYSSSDAYYNFTGTTLEVVTNQANLAGAYGLVYSYGSGVSVDTKSVQVGSGATSITFTGLEDEPLYWVCAFKSSFGTSSGYQRVIYVVYDGTSILGMEMDSAAKASDSHWTANYSNGTLTITSQGTNAGGYFHQPGNYQLTYAYGGEPSPYQAKTVTPTTSQQIVEPDAGYEALSQVTVNAIPSTYVQPTSTVGSTTYRASTSNQTIQSGTYHSAAATIAAVSQTNLSAENIKSGTTISISNGQSNIWSVTGTYTGGGGSVNVATTTWTNNSNTATSHQFTGLSGTPKAAFLRCTTSLSRSSSSTNYFIADMVWNGTSCVGNSFRRSNGTYANVTSGYTVTTGSNSITFTSSGTSTTNPGSFYNGTYELIYVY